MKKLLQISNIAAFTLTILINYLSNTGIFGGRTISNVSSNYRNLFTPAGYAFSVWGIIYIGLFAFVIYQARGVFKKVNVNIVVSQIRWWFVVSCLANSLWVIAWLYDYTGASVLLMLILLFSLLKIIVNTDMELDDAPLHRVAFVWWPFCIYSGWISVALIANIAAYLTKIKWNGFGIPDVTWTIIMISAAGIVNLFMTWKRNMREFALVGVWGLIAVAVANINGAQSIVITAVVVSGILFISSSLHAYSNRNSFPWRHLF